MVFYATRIGELWEDMYNQGMIVLQVTLGFFIFQRGV